MKASDKFRVRDLRHVADKLPIECHCYTCSPHHAISPVYPVDLIRVTLWRGDSSFHVHMTRQQAYDLARNLTAAADQGSVAEEMSA